MEGLGMLHKYCGFVKRVRGGGIVVSMVVSLGVGRKVFS